MVQYAYINVSFKFEIGVVTLLNISIHKRWKLIKSSHISCSEICTTDSNLKKKKKLQSIFCKIRMKNIYTHYKVLKHQTQQPYIEYNFYNLIITIYYLLLLLSCVTCEVKPCIGFKVKGVTLLLICKAHFSMAGVRFLPLYDRWQHHPSISPQF